MNDNPLNGVTAYDLVLICKHILGIQSLVSPYKIIAADANKTHSISTADIVELRKLILGINSHFTNNSSWRFIPKDYVFPNISDPSIAPFQIMDSVTAQNAGDYIGIKIGDVNNSANGGLRPVETALSYGALSASAGALIEVPVFAGQDLEQSAWQMALRYDPARLQLLDVRWASPLTSAFQGRDWHETAPGHIRLLWYDGEGKGSTRQRGTPLFFLKFKCLSDITDPAPALEDSAIPCLSYTASGAVSAFSLDAASMALCRREEAPAVSPDAADWHVRVYPNPAGEHFRIDISVPDASPCHIAIFDLLGRTCREYDADLNAGFNSLEQSPGLPAGQYLLQCSTALGSRTLRFEKR